MYFSILHSDATVYRLNPLKLHCIRTIEAEVVTGPLKQCAFMSTQHKHLESLFQLLFFKCQSRFKRAPVARSCRVLFYHRLLLSHTNTKLVPKPCHLARIPRGLFRSPANVNGTPCVVTIAIRHLTAAARNGKLQMIPAGVGGGQVDVRARRWALRDESRGGKRAFDGGCKEPSKTVKKEQRGCVWRMERLISPSEDRGG